jgi:hypothetical protein
MKVYHGSTVCVREQKLLPSSRRLDFGTGFYTTSDFNQAQRWARIKMRRVQSNAAIVSVYDASEIFTAKNLQIKSFDAATEEWLNFIMLHRTGRQTSTNKYDVIRGPVANDTLYETLALYERGILTHDETIARLKTHKLADQVVLASTKAISLLRFIGCEEVN